MQYFCDDSRHLVCTPYSIDNLHLMANDLDIKRCWYHSKSKYPHYDIPKRQIERIKSRCHIVSSRNILSIVKGYWNDLTLRVADDSKFWWKDGLLHRLDGPAIEYANGTKHWFYNGLKVKVSSQKEYESWLNLKIFW